MRKHQSSLSIALALGSVAIASPPCGSPAFPGRIFPLPQDPRLITPIDLDEQGPIDVLIAHRDGIVPVLSGINGTLLPQSAVRTGHDIEAVVVADFNDDGHDDVAVTDRIGMVTVLLGDGAGALLHAGDYATGLWPLDMTSGDLDGNGTIDLAVTIWHDVNPALILLFGQGDGTFATPEFHAMQILFRSIAAVDADRDGDVDFVGMNDDLEGSSSLATLVNDGTGTFTLGAQLPQDELRAMTVADMTGDGIPDVIGRLQSSVLIFAGRGDGTFASSVDTEVVATISAFAVSDVDRDGDLDVTALSDRFFRILENDGEGNLEITARHHSNKDPDGLAMADVSGDGWPDVVFGTDRGVVAIVGAGDGTFVAATVLDMPSLSGAAATGDLNGDGHADIVGLNRYSTLSVFLGRGDGTFDDRVDYAAPSNANAVRIADFDHDGVPDMAVSRDEEPGAVRVYLGTGDGVFGPTTDYSMPGAPRSLAVGHVDADDHPDLVVASWAEDHLSIRRGLGDGTFDPPMTVPTGNGPVTVAIADITGDGINDIVTGDATGGTISVVRGIGDGTFAAATQYPCPNPFEPQAIAVGDLNRDGHLDVVAANYPDNIAVFLGDGDGGLEAAVTYEAGDGVQGIAVGDLDGDSIDDLAASNGRDDSLSILRGFGDGTFAVVDTLALSRAGGPLMADIDSDGDLDLISRIAVLRNDTCPVGDINGDGVVDYGDIMSLLVMWGVCPDPPGECPADLNGDGAVGYADLLQVLANWT